MNNYIAAFQRQLLYWTVIGGLRDNVLGSFEKIQFSIGNRKLFVGVTSLSWENRTSRKAETKEGTH